MSYARFGWDGSDVYIYEHCGGFLECCGCSLTDPESGEDVGFYHANTPRDMLRHIDAHRVAGDHVPLDTDEGIKLDNPDLDKQIEPYTIAESDETRRRKEILRKMLEGPDELR